MNLCSMRLSKYAAVGILLPAISSLVLAKVDFTKDIRPILSVNVSRAMDR